MLDAQSLKPAVGSFLCGSPVVSCSSFLLWTISSSRRPGACVVHLQLVASPPHQLCAVSPRVLLRKHPILTVALPTGSSLWAPFCLSHLCPSQGLTPHRHRMAARYEAYLRKEVLLLSNPCFSSLFHLSIHATSSASSLDSTFASTRGIAALAKPTFRQMAVTCLFNYLGFVYPM